MVQVVAAKRNPLHKKNKTRKKFMRTSKRAPATPAQVAERQKVRAHRAQRIAEVSAAQNAELAALASELGVTEEWLKIRFNLKHRSMRSTRAPNAFNAFLSAKAPDCTRYSGRSKLKLMAQDEEYKAEYEALSRQERDDYVEQLKTRREEKENAGHHAAAAQHADAQHNVKKTVEILTGVANRCNGIFVLFYANKDGDAFSTGIHAVSQEATPFFTHTLKTTPAAFAGRFDSFAQSGGAVVEVKAVNNVNQLKTTARTLITQAFRKLVPRDGAKIFYNPLRMLERYQLEFFGWRGSELPDPSKINTAPPLNELITALEAGTCGWRAVDEVDVEGRKQALLERAEAAGVVLDAPRQQRKDAGTTRGKRTLGDATNGAEPAA